ncbi:hypothetical protein POJ06DRAFT_278829 [Lipomyces tetrasporus]|uniref:FK506-binding protein n=1 Tax=Lipomyces tetrasporus TaxID=54092 RepID=A0AAD7VPP8_9ASCO|nr:uncharacterized protein POJ06DRAFT_278829 [Lipomyces tetrasporus]KAJ8096699.1 hypothetical protein POJ06DRAFT_278829 [Lipomyces tetrasporus]
MSGLLPIATYTLKVPPGVPVTASEEDFPVTLRITMAAIDPEAVDDKKAPSTLRILKKPTAFPDGGLLLGDDEDDDEDDEDFEGDDEEDDDEDDDEDDEEEEEEEEEEKEKKSKKTNGVKESKKDADVEMGDGDDDEDDDDEDDDDEDEDEYEIEDVVLCTLSPETLYQQPLDLVITPDEEILFEVTGSYTICLIGNYVDHPYDRQDDFDESESDEDYDLSPDEDELIHGYGDEDESDELDSVDEHPRVKELPNVEEEIKKEAKALKEEAKAEAKAAVKEKGKKANGKRPAEEEEVKEKNLDDMIEKDNKGAEKLSKKQAAKKLKGADGSAAPAPAEKESLKDKKVTFAKNLEQGPTGSGAPNKAAEPAKTVQVKKLEGGLAIEDRKVGDGTGAKNGQKVGVRYIGKLSNGKVFDSNTKGKPFVFTLGKGEVIKGWDLGVKGMAVNGERRIIVPAPLAYGKKSLPGIPANSTLTFDVKLISIK